jgi:hypothetical protein
MGGDYAWDHCRIQGFGVASSLSQKDLDLGFILWQLWQWCFLQKV